MNRIQCICDMILDAVPDRGDHRPDCMQPSSGCLSEGLPADDRRIVVGADISILHQDSLDSTVRHRCACILRSSYHAQPGNVAIENADYDSGFLFIDDSLSVTVEGVSVGRCSCSVPAVFDQKYFRRSRTNDSDRV